MEIYKDNPDIDHVELFNIEEYTKRLLNRPKDLYNFFMELKKAVNRLKAMKFDLLINTTHDRFSTFLAHLIAPPEIEGMYISASNRLRIQINGFWFRYLRCASEFRDVASFNLADIYKNAVGGNGNSRGLFFHTYPDLLTKADELLEHADHSNTKRTFIGFQLGTSTGNRRWPSEYFIALGDMLQKNEETQVVLLGTKNEKKLSERVAGQMERAPINLIGKTSISLLAAVLKRCNVLVTNDTGTMHLAEAVGTKCAALFFESANPFQTGPYGSGHFICAPDIECFPCSTTYKCHDKKCLKCISSEAVCQLVSNLLDSDFTVVDLPAGMRIYKTQMNNQGIWDAWPFKQTPIYMNDLIRKIYKNMWLRYAYESGEFSSFGKDYDLHSALSDGCKQWAEHHPIDVETKDEWLKIFKTSFKNLDQEIDRAISILTELAIAGQTDSFDRDFFTSKSDEIGRVDQKITASIKKEPWLSQLVHFFKLELDQIHDTEFFTMLNAWKRAYDNLKRKVRILKEETQRIEMM